MNLSEIRIDANSLRQNVQALRALAAPAARVCVVVKANAYGHGIKEVIQALESEIDLFQVDDLLELRALREHSSLNALVLGYVAQWEIESAMRLGCEMAVVDIDHLRMVGQAARGLALEQRIHLKIDALLGRLGVLPDQVGKALQELEKWPELKLAGVYAHYANIEDTTDLTHADAQRGLLAQVEELLPGDVPTHISATSGLMTIEALDPRDLVRIGVGAYGMYPSIPLARSHRDLKLKPVLTWISHLAQVKTLPARHPIGYGLTFVTSRPTKIGIVPQGYSDGYDRGLSNSGEVLVRGVRCPVLGRIAMNMFAVDLNDVPDAQQEDEVVLLGKQGDEQVLAEDLAARLGTINYEITSRISPLLPRVLI